MPPHHHCDLQAKNPSKIIPRPPCTRPPPYFLHKLHYYYHNCNLNIIKLSFSSSFIIYTYSCTYKHTRIKCVRTYIHIFMLYLNNGSFRCSPLRFLYRQKVMGCELLKAKIKIIISSLNKHTEQSQSHPCNYFHITKNINSCHAFRSVIFFYKAYIYI